MHGFFRLFSASQHARAFCAVVSHFLDLQNQVNIASRRRDKDRLRKPDLGFASSAPSGSATRARMRSGAARTWLRRGGAWTASRRSRRRRRTNRRRGPRRSRRSRRRTRRPRRTDCPLSPRLFVRYLSTDKHIDHLLFLGGDYLGSVGVSWRPFRVSHVN